MARLAAACAVAALAVPAAGAPAPHILSRRWEASWITCPGAPARDPALIRFRKAFDLDQVPASFLVHVSADQRFVLHANGARVGMGPARGDVFHWRFESFDLAPYLRPGRNVLVAVVWSFGSEAPVAQVTDRTGFVLEANSEAGAVARSGASWECALEPGHEPWPDGLSELRARGTYIVVGPGEQLDASRYDWSWRELPGDAERWGPARAYAQPSPRSISEGPGWALSPAGRWLVPDPLPPMEYRPVPPGSVVRAEGLDGATDFPDAPLAIPAGTRATLLLDRRELVAAFPRLRFSGGRGARIEIAYQEALVDGDFSKGHRDEIEGKRLVGLSDAILPDGGKDRVFEPLWWRTWRYLELRVETGAEPLRLDDLQAFATGYPFEERAAFSADSAGLDRIWDVGWRTARLCAHETYMDCPYYEQLQYVGDTRIQALISYAVAGDDRLARQAIRAFEQSRRSEGLTSSRYPAAEPQYIPGFSLLWIGMVHDFWRYRDDPEFVRAQLSGVRSVLDFFLERRRDDGLVERLPYWSFVDWADDFASGVPPQLPDGGSTAIALQLVLALDEAADLEEAVGDPERARSCRKAADVTRRAVLDSAWNETRGLVADLPGGETFSQQANILAILADAVPDAGRVLDRLLEQPGLTPASYYFRFYLARALEKLDREDDYLPLLDPWREMLDLGLSTWAERPTRTRSDCHAWSAHPNYDLLTLVAGIRPDGPGFRRVRIEPHLGELGRLEASMPHPLGEIRVEYVRRDGPLEATVALPPDLPGELVVGGRTFPLRAGDETRVLVD